MRFTQHPTPGSDIEAETASCLLSKIALESAQRRHGAADMSNPHVSGVPVPRHQTFCGQTPMDSEK